MSGYSQGREIGKFQQFFKLGLKAMTESLTLP